MAFIVQTENYINDNLIVYKIHCDPYIESVLDMIYIFL